MVIWRTRVKYQIEILETMNVMFCRGSSMTPITLTKGHVATVSKLQLLNDDYIITFNSGRSTQIPQTCVKVLKHGLDNHEVTNGVV